MPLKRLINIELRGFILQHAIRQEALTSAILKIIFRTLKDKTKTLGNNSGNLTFKNKIDLLYDFGDIEKKDYTHFEKLLAIRNQFAHNSNCTSFVKLKEENSKLTEHLETNFGNSETDEEKKLLLSYISLFKKCHRVLIDIKRAYNFGFLIYLERYQSYEILHNRFWDWTSQAKENFEEHWSKYNLDKNEMVKPLKLTFFIATLDAFKYKLFSEIAYETSEGKRLGEIFKKKMSDSEWKSRSCSEGLNIGEENAE